VGRSFFDTTARSRPGLTELASYRSRRARWHHAANASSNGSSGYGWNEQPFRP
jgi:hypothetical protein